MHDSRVGRFFAVDPMAKNYPYNSPYAFSENRVIDGVEFEGKEFKPTNTENGMNIELSFKIINQYQLNKKLYEGTYQNVAAKFISLFEGLTGHDDRGRYIKFDADYSATSSIDVFFRDFVPANGVDPKERYIAKRFTAGETEKLADGNIIDGFIYVSYLNNSMESKTKDSDESYAYITILHELIVHLSSENGLNEDHPIKNEETGLWTHKILGFTIELTDEEYHKNIFGNGSEITPKQRGLIADLILKNYNNFEQRDENNEFIEKPEIKKEEIVLPNNYLKREKDDK